MKYKDDVVAAILKEISLTPDFLKGKQLSTIYFGGGTPSILSSEDFALIFNQLEAHYSLDCLKEVTVECNPDDVTPDFIRGLEGTPVNRYSLGVQSFYDDDLRALNRTHTKKQVFQAIELIAHSNAKSWTLDLIYGLPEMTMERWMSNLQMTHAVDAPHISAYALTVEPRTALYHFIQKRQLRLPDDGQVTAHFDALMRWAGERGYEHYEISNYALRGHRAVHNSSYWEGQAYLGLGPGAHSFDGASIRRWNVRNNPIYVRKIARGEVPYTSEMLTPDDLYNEYVMTRLRLSSGVSRMDLSGMGERYLHRFEEAISPHVESTLIQLSEGHWRLTDAGKHFADRIASDAFII